MLVETELVENALVENALVETTLVETELGVIQQLQGPSWQSVYFKLILMGRNVQVRFCL